MKCHRTGASAPASRSVSAALARASLSVLVLATPDAIGRATGDVATSEADPFEAMALRFDRAAVHFHEPLHDRQSYAQPSFAAIDRAFALREELEHLRQQIRQGQCNSRDEEIADCSSESG